jgi:F0F1-type ATP synthase membrane subunit b/b'
MEFTDFMIWKLIAMCVVVVVYQFWRGVTGQIAAEREQALRDSQSDPHNG